MANNTVATFIADAFPDRAMLRCHPEPNERKMGELERFSREQGIDIDASSSRALHLSLRRLKEQSQDAYEVAQLMATASRRGKKAFAVPTRNVSLEALYFVEQRKRGDNARHVPSPEKCVPSPAARRRGR